MQYMAKIRAIYGIFKCSEKSEALVTFRKLSEMLYFEKTNRIEAFCQEWLVSKVEKPTVEEVKSTTGNLLKSSTQLCTFLLISRALDITVLY